MKVKSGKWNIDLIFMAEIAVVCIMLIPILIISFYTIPAADDFVNSVTVRESLLQHRSYMAAAISEVVYYYKNISGYFFGAFLNFYISPLLRGGIGTLRAAVFIINLFFYISLYYLIYELLKFFYNIQDAKKTLLIYIFVLFSFLNNVYNSEMISWYCTMIGYAFVVACMFWGIIFFLKAIQSEKLKYAIAASVLGFLSSGGSLNITALNCGIYLLIAYVDIAFHKKKTTVICFASALAGGVINVAAPGNFARHGVDSYPVFGALRLAVYYGKEELQEILFYSPFILLLCIFLVFMLKVIHNPRPIRGISLVIYAVFIFMGIVVVNFPVCLGYIVDYFPDRCIWVQNCVIYFGGFTWTACLAEWIKSRFGNFEIRKDAMIFISISFVLYGCNLCSLRDPSDYPTIDMIKQLANGEIAEYVDYWMDVFEEIEYSEEQGVVIYREEIKKNQFILYPLITENIDHEMNRGIADYYGKEWVYMTTDRNELP